MSENNERYIDPNSGAASQPGGFVSPGAQPVESAGTSDADEAYEGAQEHSAAPAGEQPGGSSGDSAGTDAQPEAGGGDSDSSAEAQAADGGDGGSEEGDDEESAKDYSELLSKNVPDVKEYLDEHPDEVEAVKAAEADGENRKGIAEYEPNAG